MLFVGFYDFEPNQQSDIDAFEVEDTELTDFWDDSQLIFKPRSYYLNRNRDETADSKGWALGGELQFSSGWWNDTVRFNASAFTSQKLYGPDNKDGTTLFKPGPESFSVLGEANVTVRFAEEQGLRIGRQRFELPYLGSHDIRMVPNTFEAVAVGKPSKVGFGYMLGYVDSIKRKNDDEFISMSEAAGAADTDEGLLFAGAQYIIDGQTTVAGTYQKTENVFDTTFAKIEHSFGLSETSALKAFFQYTGQSSVGDELIGNFTTSMMAGKLEYVVGDVKWRVALSSTDEESGLQKPFGNPSNYLSVIVDDFDRAGEDAWLIGVSYNFKQIGPGELSMFANVVEGDTPETGIAASPDETEYDITFDYRVKEGWADGLWLRVRGAWVDRDEDFGGEDFFDFRIIANYEVKIF
ncbi:MAG: outer membrane porin, OprD family [Gammaproteobacteria bacterium]|nr:outer membrane porin, OprD family [Gammaproteobacteria bacterium]